LVIFDIPEIVSNSEEDRSQFFISSAISVPNLAVFPLSAHSQTVNTRHPASSSKTSFPSVACAVGIEFIVPELPAALWDGGTIATV
jgi:hypothetical protein